MAFEHHIDPAQAKHPGGRYRSENSRFAREADNRAKAAITLERLRYRHYQRRGSLSNFMQRLGDFGRKYCPWLNVRFRQ